MSVYLIIISYTVYNTKYTAKKKGINKKKIISIYLIEKLLNLTKKLIYISFESFTR